MRSRGTDFTSLGDAREPSREDGLDVGELAKTNADTLGRALAARRLELVFPDGRWSIDEKQLCSPPSEGDVVVFDGYGDWRIQGSERVGAKPRGKRSREFFVCAPAA